MKRNYADNLRNACLRAAALALLVFAAASPFAQEIDPKTPEAWSAPFRGWHYYPDHVIPPAPPIPGYESVKMTDVPTVFQIPGDSKWYMTFIGFDGNGYQSFVAESDDLTHWSKFRLAMGYGPEGDFDHGGVVLGAYLYESYDLKAPRLLKKRDGQYWSLYGAYPRQGGYELRPGYEGVAVSDDGLRWRRAIDRPILSVHQEDVGDWEKDCIYQPWLVEQDGRFLNFYNAANGSIEQTGLARSNNLLDWTRHAGNPVVPIGNKGSFNEVFSSDPKVFRDGDHWTMIFFGVGRGHAHIMAAFSRDLEHWTVDPDPLYQAGGHPDGLDAEHAHKVSLVFNPANETYYMFYNAVGTKGRGIGLLTSKPIAPQTAPRGIHGDEPFLQPADLDFLQSLHTDVLEASRVAAGASVGGIGPNTSGGTLIRPGGRDAYPAFWIRDYAMSLAAGGITLEEQRHHLLLTARNQIDETVTLPSGSVLPPGAIPDHIAFGGAPIYFPGILEDYEAQGGAQWGWRPCIDDQFYFIHMAYHYILASGDTTMLDTEIDGKRLKTRLEEAFAMPESRAETGIVYTTDATRGGNFGFMDTTVHTGDLLFASLLKFRAAQQLAWLLEKGGDPAGATRYRETAAALKAALPGIFAMEDGWLRASTGKSSQCDVWGTAFAVYIGALDGEVRARASQALAHALQKGTIAWEGGIRHVPTDRDARPDTAWEFSYAAHNTYQNGAYWNTSVAWVVQAVAEVDRHRARALVQDYLAQLRADDFRRGPDHGAPWECRHPAGNHQQNPVYLTSVAIPLAVFREIAEADASTTGAPPPSSPVIR